MRLLVPGGTRFVGRALVEDAVARGWQVTALHRDVGPLPAGVERLRADRTDPAGLQSVLAGRSFDLSVDTWALPPTPLDAVRADRFGYVSSGVGLPVGRARRRVVAAGGGGRRRLRCGQAAGRAGVAGRGRPPQRTDRAVHGLPEELERMLLARPMTGTD